jgi:hypothetical protein
MHDFILRECEVGFRVAAAEDSEACGWGPLMDLDYELYCRARPDIADIAEGEQDWGLDA